MSRDQTEKAIENRLGIERTIFDGDYITFDPQYIVRDQLFQIVSAIDFRYEDAVIHHIQDYGLDFPWNMK